MLKETETLKLNELGDRYENAYRSILHDLTMIYEDYGIDYRDEFEILEELVDKETPKNVVKRTMPIIDEVYCCSKCGQHVELTQNYCDKCGQKLDWEIEDDPS